MTPDRRTGASRRDWREQMDYLRRLKRLADFKYGWRSELGQFYLVGASGMVVDLVSFAALLGAGIALPLARALSIAVALTWNFTLNRQLTFANRRFGRSVINQYFLWLLSSGLGATISWSVSVMLSVFANFFARRVLLAAIIGIAFGSVTNLFLARRWVFQWSGWKRAYGRSLIALKPCRRCTRPL